MKKYFWLLAFMTSLCGCSETQDENAAPLLGQIEALYKASLLQATLQSLEGKRALYERNILRAKCDSLRARYEAMCGVVRMIRYRQQHP